MSSLQVRGPEWSAHAMRAEPAKVTPAPAAVKMNSLRLRPSELFEFLGSCSKLESAGLELPFITPLLLCSLRAGAERNGNMVRPLYHPEAKSVKSKLASGLGGIGMSLGKIGV